MEILGMLSIQTLLFVLIFLLIAYIFYLHYKLENKCDDVFSKMIVIINSIRDDKENEINKNVHLSESNNKENSLWTNSLIEVSEDDYSEEDSESEIDESEIDESDMSESDVSECDYNEDKNYVKQIKLNLDEIVPITDINVSLLDASKTSQEVEFEVEDLILTMDDFQEQEQKQEQEQDQQEQIINESSDEKTQIPVIKKKRESRKNTQDGDYRKMNLGDLKKYAIDNNICSEVSKLKKTELLKIIEENINSQLDNVDVDINTDIDVNVKNDEY